MRKLIYANGKEVAKRYVGSKLVWQNRILKVRTIYSDFKSSKELYWKEDKDTSGLDFFTKEDVKEVIIGGRYKLKPEDFIIIECRTYESGKTFTELLLKRSLRETLGKSYSPYFREEKRVDIYYYV